MLYETPFELAETTVVKAITIKSNSSSTVTVMEVFVQTPEELENAKSPLVGGTIFTNADGEILDSLGKIGAGGKVKVSLNADFVSEHTDITAITIFFAVYDTNGRFVGIQSKDIEVGDSGIAFMGTFDLPSAKEIGSIRLFTVSDKMIPLLGANSID